MTSIEAKAITGGLSSPGKMPGRAYNLPAQLCKLGSVLATKAGSVCSGCYALKGRYRMPTVAAALQRRYESLSDPRWVDAMVTLLLRQRSKWFRWMDSGDIQSLSHLSMIAEVCRQTPKIHHWLPTREITMVKTWLRGNECPSNLNIRISSHYVDRHGARVEGCTYSTVHRDINLGGYKCPARQQGNKCGKCRACWDRNVEHVSYPKH